jgi:hypothetical protein
LAYFYMFISRSVKSVDFAREAAEHRRELQQPPTKKFKSSAAPKGTKLPPGYQNRALLRKLNEGNSDTRADEGIEHQIKALEEQVKLRQIDKATFEKLCKEIKVGGNADYTHLVKGLDWELLKRIKSGEDVLNPPEHEAIKDEETASGREDDVNDEFDRVLEEKEQDIAPPKGNVRKGTVSPPSGESGKKISRDEILKQLRAKRAVIAASSREPEPSESSLGSKFKRIGDERRVEQDKNGRRKEVLIVTDSHGKTKRKVRWLDKTETQTTKDGLLVPDKNVKPLGMEVPADIASKAAAAEKSEDEDIFEGVGLDYNPLADLSDDESASESEKEAEGTEGPNADPKTSATGSDAEGKPAPETSKPRNYFSTSSTTVEMADSAEPSNPLTTDPTILAALKRAAALRQASPSGAAEDEEDVDPETLLRRRKFLEEARRREAEDALDIDYGFGSSRIADEEDEEGGIWEGQSGNKRKRGPKKRKGDKDNVADIMKVLDGRKKGDKS